MTNKRGLSDVVTVVLIILLALAAIGIIWAFIRPALDTAGSNIDLSTECLKTEVKPVNCAAETDKVTVQFAKGEKERLFEILVIVEKELDSSTVIEKILKNDIPELLGSKEVPFTYNIVLGDTAKATVVLDNGEGQTYTCDPSPVVVDCA